MSGPVTELTALRGMLTLILMLLFIVLVVWLYAKKHPGLYEAAARLPLEDDAANHTPRDAASRAS